MAMTRLFMAMSRTAHGHEAPTEHGVIRGSAVVRMKAASGSRQLTSIPLFLQVPLLRYCASYWRLHSESSFSHPRVVEPSPKPRTSTLTDEGLKSAKACFIAADAFWASSLPEARELVA